MKLPERRHNSAKLICLLLLLLLLTLSACTFQPPLAAQPPLTAQQPIDLIAFGSCANQERSQPIWDAVVASRPDLFVFLGDNIYGDTADMNLLRAKYAQLGAKAGYQRLQATTQVIATWDDHDYGGNDFGAEYPQKAASRQIFLDFFHEPAEQRTTAARWRRLHLLSLWPGRPARADDSAGHPLGSFTHQPRWRCRICGASEGLCGTVHRDHRP